MRFIHEYLKDLNASKAAIRAGFSVKNADVVGPKLLTIASVRKEIDAAIARREHRLNLQADDVVRELHRAATVDVAHAFDRNGALLQLHEMSEDVRRAIVSVEVDEMKDSDGNVYGYTRKVKFNDKLRALELLGKHLGMFVERHEHEAGAELLALLKSAPEQMKQIAADVAGMSPDEQTEVARGKH
jgi:phage terminase small subunit